MNVERVVILQPRAADIKEDNPNVVEFEPMPTSVPVPEVAPATPVTVPAEPVPA